MTREKAARTLATKALQELLLVHHAAEVREIILSDKLSLQPVGIQWCLIVEGKPESYYEEPEDVVAIAIEEMTTDEAEGEGGMNHLQVIIKNNEVIIVNRQGYRAAFRYEPLDKTTRTYGLCLNDHPDRFDAERTWERINQIVTDSGTEKVVLTP